MKKAVGKIIVLDSVPNPHRNFQKVNRTIDLSIPTQEEEENLNNLPNLPLPIPLEKRIFPHQKYGVNWLYRLHIKGVGGLLGDEMGLGKTFQVVALLTGLLLKNEIKRILIISPVSVLLNWEKEVRDHLLPHLSSVNLFSVNSDVSKKKRMEMLNSSSSRHIPSIVVSSHQIVSNMIEEFAKEKWDYVILDEGHVIKNHQTKLWKSLSQLPSRHRILCTGTPVQNNLTEFWALMDWATKGTVFGSAKAFASNIADPISKGQDPHAKPEHIDSALEAIKLLVNLTKPVLLQRKKKEKFASSVLKLPEKKELVVWISLSSDQRSMYSQYVCSGKFRSILTQASYPVEVINYLRTLCRHSLLLEYSSKKRRQLLNHHQQSPSSFFVDDDEEEDAVDYLTQSISNLNMSNHGSSRLSNSEYIFDVLGYTPSIEAILRGSIKLRVLMKLISNLLDETEENQDTTEETSGHRVLVFSQSKLMLQIIQYLLAEHGVPCFMIDGSTCAKDRQAIINEFNYMGSDYSGPRICLLTTKACGVGITLTAADRVIIFDPSWNPAEDSQAVDRVYRIGQTKNVLVYRFILASCIEEKIYEKQVFKEGLRVVSEKGLETEKYFKGKSQLNDLLSLRNEDVEILQRLQNHPEDLQTDKLNSCYGIVGCTRHDQLYSADSISTNSSSNSGKDPQEQACDLTAKNANPLTSQHSNPSTASLTSSSIKLGKKDNARAPIMVVDNEEAEWSDSDVPMKKSSAGIVHQQPAKQISSKPLIIDLTQAEENEDHETITVSPSEPSSDDSREKISIHEGRGGNTRSLLFSPEIDEDSVNSRPAEMTKNNRLIFADEEEEEEEEDKKDQRKSIHPLDGSIEELFDESIQQIEDVPFHSEFSLVEDEEEKPRFSKLKNDLNTSQRRETIEFSLLRSATPPLESPLENVEAFHQGTNDYGLEDASRSVLSGTVVESDQNIINPMRYSLYSTGTLNSSPSIAENTAAGSPNYCKESIEIPSDIIPTACSQNETGSDLALGISQLTLSNGSIMEEERRFSTCLEESRLSILETHSRRETLQSAASPVPSGCSPIQHPIGQNSNKEQEQPSILSIAESSEYYDNSLSRTSLNLFEVQEIYSLKCSREEEEEGVTLSRQTTASSAETNSSINSRISSTRESSAGSLHKDDGTVMNETAEPNITQRQQRLSTVFSEYCNPDIFFSPPQSFATPSVTSQSCFTEGRDSLQSPETPMHTFSHDTESNYSAASGDTKENCLPIIESKTPTISQKQERSNHAEFETPFKNNYGTVLSSPPQTMSATPSFSSIKIKAISTSMKKDRVLQQLSGKKIRQSSNRDSFLCLAAGSSPLDGSTEAATHSLPSPSPLNKDI